MGLKSNVFILGMLLACVSTAFADGIYAKVIIYGSDNGCTVDPTAYAWRRAGVCLSDTDDNNVTTYSVLTCPTGAGGIIRSESNCNSDCTVCDTPINVTPDVCAILPNTTGAPESEDAYGIAWCIDTSVANDSIPLTIPGYYGTYSKLVPDGTSGSTCKTDPTLVGFLPSTTDCVAEEGSFASGKLYCSGDKFVTALYFDDHCGTLLFKFVLPTGECSQDEDALAPAGFTVWNTITCGANAVVPSILSVFTALFVMFYNK